MRINKFIAGNTEFSRRKADELIKSGAVIVNGKIAEIGLEVGPSDNITINGKPIETGKDKIYIAINKPAGYITTRNDPQGRKTIMDLLPEFKNLKPAGRLDYDSEGLLILSNDGDFINQLLHPKFICEKEYFVIVSPPLSDKNKQLLENGVMVDDKLTSKSKITILKQKSEETHLTIIITEGRKRQIKKMFKEVGSRVIYLKRLRIGKIELKSLKKGHFRHLTGKEIDY